MNYNKIARLARNVERDHNEKLSGSRFYVTYNDSCDLNGEHSIRVVDDYPEDGYRGRLIDTRYADGLMEWTDWGQQTDVPSQWTNENIEQFLEIRANGVPLSEVLYDRFLNSDAKDITLFLQAEKEKQESQTLDGKVKILLEKLGDKLGKTADVKTGKVTDEHRKIAKQQVEISKTIMKANREKRGGL